MPPLRWEQEESAPEEGFLGWLGAIEWLAALDHSVRSSEFSYSRIAIKIEDKEARGAIGVSTTISIVFASLGLEDELPEIMENIRNLDPAISNHQWWFAPGFTTDMDVTEKFELVKKCYPKRKGYRIRERVRREEQVKRFKDWFWKDIARLGRKFATKKVVNNLRVFFCHISLNQIAKLLALKTLLTNKSGYYRSNAII
jgi:hypothetical protein